MTLLHPRALVCFVALCCLSALSADRSRAAFADEHAPCLNGSLSGLEICPQSWCGAAFFLFEFDGELNGRSERGFGWIAAVHGELPTVEGESSPVTDGFGIMVVGFQVFTIDITRGLLTLVDDHDTAAFDDDFDVTVSLQICNLFGQCEVHVADVLLSHQTFIPTIEGGLSCETPE